MASSNSDDQNLGNETLESSSSSSFRRGKKRNSDKSKKPLRGLGVAQLEKIRLHEMSSTYHHNPYFENFSQEDMGLQATYSSSSFSYSSLSSPSYGFRTPHGIMIGCPDLAEENIKYEESQQINATRQMGFDPSGLRNPTVCAAKHEKTLLEPTNTGFTP
ncbi:protein SPEAR3-like isoform X4 [Olea europaea var. sylvestris]|uniref:Uncharacterized protein n=1 Tax=Olea europaea subsp. europaea TaxID=158383 RepID=A0A8S0PFW0_OLEEU|nr:protein SPEAR3-like isoform X4 [Olea europaea var. sylvestris]CAA2947143.1 Hypothetical predicted protein [Olea europaea subsp. europaea]